MRDPRTSVRICAFHIVWLDLPSFSVLVMPINGLKRAELIIVAADEEPMGRIRWCLVYGFDYHER
jgi:hypothetical protein